MLPWQEGAEASVLPRAYQDLLEVAADAGRPLRAGELAAAAGLPADKAKMEGLRSKLKLMEARRWLARRQAACSPWLITQGKQKTPAVMGSSSLSPEVLIHPDPKKEEILTAAYGTVPPDDPVAVSKGMLLPGPSHPQCA